MFHFEYVEPNSIGVDAEERKRQRDEATKRFIPGSASFEIKKVLTHDKEGQVLSTKSGDPKIVIIIELEDAEFNKADILMHITRKMGFRIHGLCMAIGRPELYAQSGLDTSKIIGCRGKCMMEGKTDEYGYKLDITKFLEPSAHSMSIEEAVQRATGFAPTEADNVLHTEFRDGDIPF